MQMFLPLIDRPDDTPQRVKAISDATCLNGLTDMHKLRNTP